MHSIHSKHWIWLLLLFFCVLLVFICTKWDQTIALVRKSKKQKDKRERKWNVQHVKFSSISAFYDGRRISDRLFSMVTNPNQIYVRRPYQLEENWTINNKDERWNLFPKKLLTWLTVRLERLGSRLTADESPEKPEIEQTRRIVFLDIWPAILDWARLVIPAWSKNDVNDEARLINLSRSCCWKVEFVRNPSRNSKWSTIDTRIHAWKDLPQ